MNIGDREWQIRRSTRAPLRPPPHPPTTTHTGGAHTRPRICIRTRREDRGRPRDTRDSPVCNTRGARATPATLPWLPRFGGSRRAKPPATPPMQLPPPRFRAARKVGGGWMQVHATRGVANYALGPGQGRLPSHPQASQQKPSWGPSFRARAPPEAQPGK